MKKRYYIFVLISLLCVVFVGCDNTENTYYEIPKSEVVDVSSLDKESIVQTAEKGEKKSQSNKYFTYKNERFGFSVDVPDYLKLNGNSDDDDGAYFETIDGDIYLSVYGSYSPNMYYDYPDIDNIYMDELAEMDYTPKFTEKNSNSFEIAWDEYNTVYWKKYYLKSDGTENILILSYPLAKEKEYEDDIKHILDSFMMGSGYDSDVVE